MRLQSLTDQSLTIRVETPLGRCEIDTTDMEFQSTVDCGVVEIGTVTFRATIYKHDNWVQLNDETPDPVLANGGRIASDYIAEQEADPRVAAALARLRKRAAFQLSSSERLNLSGLRMRAGFSQRQLAEKMNTQQPAIARWEKDPEQMTFTTIRQMAAALGIPEQEIFDAQRSVGESSSHRMIQLTEAV